MILHFNRIGKSSADVSSKEWIRSYGGKMRELDLSPKKSSILSGLEEKEQWERKRTELGESGECGVVKARNECSKEERVLPKCLVREDKDIFSIWQH